jgi:hypothetical protein
LFSFFRLSFLPSNRLFTNATAPTHHWPTAHQQFLDTQQLQWDDLFTRQRALHDAFETKQTRVRNEVAAANEAHEAATAALEAAATVAAAAEDAAGPRFEQVRAS